MSGKGENVGFHHICRAPLRRAEHSCDNDISVYVRAGVCLSKFVWTITSTIADGFQNDLTKLFLHHM